RHGSHRDARIAGWHPRDLDGTGHRRGIYRPGRITRRLARFAAGHLALDAVEPRACLALARIDQPHRGVARHRPAGDRHRIVAHGLVDEIVAIVVAAHGPFEADRLQRTGAELGIALRLGHRRRGDHRLFGRLLLRYRRI